MTSSIKGFEELESTLDSLGNIGNRIGKKAVKEGMKSVIEQMKADAPKDSSQGAKALKITTAKTYKTGTSIVRGGINSSNWEKCKSIYFQNYGYINKGLNFKGQNKIKRHIGWMNASFEKSKNKGEKIIRQYVENEISKIIK